MKFHEFAITVVFAVMLTLLVLQWALLHDKLCSLTDGEPRIWRCVVVVTR